MNSSDNTSPVASATLAVSTAVPASLTALAPPIAAIDAEIASLQAALDAAAQKKTALAREAEEMFLAKVAEVPAFLGVATLKDVLALIKHKISEAFTESASAHVNGHGTAFIRKAPTKGKPLGQSTLGQMRAMLTQRETAPHIADILKVGLSTVEAYKARWGMTKHHRQGIPLNVTLHRHGLSTNRISPHKRNEIVAALSAGRSTVTRLAERFGISRQSLYTIKRGMNGKHAVAA